MATKQHPDIQAAIDNFKIAEEVSKLLENDQDENWLEDYQELSLLGLLGGCANADGINYNRYVNVDEHICDEHEGQLDLEYYGGFIDVGDYVIVTCNDGMSFLFDEEML